MPLAYEVTKALDIPATNYNADGLASLVVHGGRYGGSWQISALADNEPLGTIFTSPDDRPAMAIDTALVWLNDETTRAGLRLVHFEDCGDQLPAGERPFFIIGRAVVANAGFVPLNP